MPLGMEVGLDPGHIVLDGDPVPPQKKEGTVAPTFQPMSIVAKNVDVNTCTVFTWVNTCFLNARILHVYTGYLL